MIDIASQMSDQKSLTYQHEFDTQFEPFEEVSGSDNEVAPGKTSFFKLKLIIQIRWPAQRRWKCSMHL